MRKDVRFAITIGAILLAVIVVYVLVVPGERPQGVTLETLNPDGTVAEPVAGADVDPAAPAADANTPAVVETAAVAQGPEITQTPALAASDEVDWSALLSRGYAAGFESRPARADNTRADNTRISRAVAPGIATSADSNAVTPALGNTPGATPAVVDPAPRDLPATPATYTVSSGDNLWTIAQKTFGDGKYHADIAAANPGLNPARLKVGQVLNLPSRASLPPAAPAPAADPASDATPVDSAKQYKIQPGDSLHRISQKLYGDGGRADDLYQLNRQLIGQDPAKIKVGMILQLPDAPSALAGAR